MFDCMKRKPDDRSVQAAKQMITRINTLKAIIEDLREENQALRRELVVLREAAAR